MRRTILLAYIVALHLAILVVARHKLFPPPMSTQPAAQLPELSEYFHRLVRYHQRSIEIVPNGSTLLIGDSITQGLCAPAVGDRAVNYGIGSDTTVGVLHRLPVYEPAIVRAHAIVIAIGLNDIKRRPDADILANMESILDMLAGKDVVLSAIHPIDASARTDMDDHPARIDDLNAAFAELANARTSVTFVNTGPLLDLNGDGVLDATFHVGDGVHLNSRGNAVWAKQLSNVITDSSG